MHKKGIIFLLVSVLIIALVFQFIRSDSIIKVAKNLNDIENIIKPSKINIPDHISKEKFLVIYDADENSSINVKNNVVNVLNYMKKEVVSTELKKYEYDSNYDCIVLTFESMNKIKDLSQLMDYIHNGKSLIFMERPLEDEAFKEIYSSLGIANYNDLEETKGIKLLSNVLFGAKGFESNEEVIENSSLQVKLKEDSKVYITTYDDIPLLWETNYGSGKIIYFNGTITNEKLNTGLIGGILSLSKNNFIYPIINSKMVNIDDFPSPVPQGIDEKIYEEYQRNIAQFYREVWWSDMLKAAHDYNVKYTGYIIETYNDKIEGPFIQDNSNAKNDLLIYGRELLKSGGEIGIHGYNHQALALEGQVKQDLGYNIWKNKEDMTKALEAVNDYGHSVFPYYKFKAFVPPSNILSPQGRDAVKEGLKNLKIISGLYTNDYLGDSYEQEFEVRDDGIIEFPRITSGYFKTDEEMWAIYNGINLFGVFSHFVHPDDILDYHRNKGKTWSQLYEEFSGILKEVHEKYWWLNANTASKAGINLVKYTESDPYIEYKENEIKIYCDNFRTNMYFILRSNNKIKSHNNCKVYHIDENVYLINMINNKALIKLENEG